MAHVREILQRTPPPVLYHYTTQQGLLGILNDKEIWATHTQYLNDASEFRHALDLVEEELLVMADAYSGDEQASKHLLELRNALTPGLESTNVCVCSFSERGDVLSQWRAYGGAASGFAIGFSGGSLQQISRDGWLVPVLYDEGAQRALVRQLLEDVLEENINRAQPDWEHLPPSGSFIAYLYRYAPILKHKSFEEEREWRIVTRPLFCSGKRFSYRTGASTLIPYFRIPLESRTSLGIKEIVIGPTPYREQSRASVRGLLTRHDIMTSDDECPESIFEDTVRLRFSGTPYRNW